jgi:hypothetical protein
VSHLDNQLENPQPNPLINLLTSPLGNLLHNRQINHLRILL